MIRRLEKRLREKLSQMVGLAYAACTTRADALWLHGQERHTGEPISMFYLGTGDSLERLVDKLYSEYQVQRREQGVRIGSAPRYLRAARDSVDLCYAELPWPYSRLYARRGFLHLPGWIAQKIALPDSWEGVLRQFRKNTKTTDLRKIRKYKLEFKLSRDDNDLRAFYEHMYVPYAQQRFKNTAVVDTLDDVRDTTARRGVLLQVLNEQRVVAGVVLYRWREEMHFLWFGILTELDEGLMDAAQSAIYLFSIQHAYDEGCVELNLSFTMPLLGDGIYRYKRKWGAAVHDAWCFGDVVASPVTFGPAVRSFMANQPMIVRENGRLIGKIFLNDPVDIDTLVKLAEGYASPGLHALKFFCMHPPAASIEDPGTMAGLPVLLIDLSKSADPAYDFCRL